MTRVVQVLALALGTALVVKALAWAVTPLLPLLAVLFVLAGLFAFVVDGRRHM